MYYGGYKVHFILVRTTVKSIKHSYSRASRGTNYNVDYLMETTSNPYVGGRGGGVSESNKVTISIRINTTEIIVDIYILFPTKLYRVLGMLMCGKY